MPFLLFLVLLLLGKLLYTIYKRQINYNKFMQEHAEEIDNYRAKVELEESEIHASLQQLSVYRMLKDSITEEMTLSDMVDAFRNMCSISVGDPDDLLFETGTYNFSGEKSFQFSLVRQFRFLDPNEYIQLHLCVHYTPSITTALLYRTKWGNPDDKHFFELIRKSLAFRLLKDKAIQSVQIYIEKT